jgi:hypothetical protein
MAEKRPKVEPIRNPTLFEMDKLGRPARVVNSSTSSDHIPTRGFCLAVVRQIVVHHSKRIYFSLGGGSSVWDCMLIRRSAKMLAENVDCAWPGFKKEFRSQKNSS